MSAPPPTRVLRSGLERWLPGVAQLAHYPPNPDADPFPDLDVFAPPAPVAKRPTTGPLAPVAAADDGVQWYMALEGARTGPFTRPDHRHAKSKTWFGSNSMSSIGLHRCSHLQGSISS